MLDVALRFLGVERADVAGGGHALPELLHLGALQDLAELGLADQEGLQQRLVAELEVRQHAQFLDRLRRQVLRLVDDQQAALALAGLADQEGLDRDQQLGLRRVLDVDAERRADHAQRVFGAELRGDQVADDDIAAVQAVDQRAQHRRLAGADLAGDDDEPLVARHAVLEIGAGAAVLLAAEVEAGVGVELERLAAQPVEAFVHGSERHAEVADHRGFVVRRRRVAAELLMPQRDRGRGAPRHRGGPHGVHVPVGGFLRARLAGRLACVGVQVERRLRCQAVRPADAGAAPASQVALREIVVRVRQHPQVARVGLIDVEHRPCF